MLSFVIAPHKSEISLLGLCNLFVSCFVCLLETRLFVVVAPSQLMRSLL